MSKTKSLIWHLAIFFLAVPSVFPETIVILHSNDTHGIYKPLKIKTSDGERWIGGMEATWHHLNAVREKEDHVIYVDTGDIMTGTLAAELEYKNVIGGLMIEFLNKLGCDVWTFGNHDFDLGLENALGLARLADFPTVNSNIVYKKTGELLPVNAYHIAEVGELKVGFIGIMSERFLIEVLKERIADLDVLKVVPTLKARIPELDRQTDLIVVMFHGKFHEALEVAKKVHGIDIILVASEEGRLEMINGAVIQDTEGHQRSLGYLRVDVEGDRVVNHRGKQVRLWADEPMNPSHEIKKLVKQVDDAIDSEYARVIGTAKRDYYYKGESVELPLGDWITDAMRWKTGAQIGFQNSGGIRDDILAGPITKGDIFEVSPFRNTLVLFKLSGKEIKELLENDVEKDWDRLQISGICYTYYPKDSKPKGDRVVRISVNGEILVSEGKVLLPDKTYTVVSNNYLVGQAKDKYFGFPIEKSKDLGVLINQVLIGWLEKHEYLDYKIQRRIVEIDN